MRFSDCSYAYVESFDGRLVSGWKKNEDGSTEKNTPGDCRLAFCEDCVTKNQMRSRTMGPPNAGAIVQVSSSSVPLSRPRSIRS